MSILYRYLMVIVACISLLIGVQIPSFVDQYQKRVDAHLREVTANLQPFQEIANKYFGGDLGKLIALNLNSNAKPLQEEGMAIEQMAKRKLRFEADMAALQTSVMSRMICRIYYAMLSPSFSRRRGFPNETLQSDTAS